MVALPHYSMPNTVQPSYCWDEQWQKLEEVYDLIEENNWPQAAIYPMDLQGATESDFEDLANTLNKEFGHLDGLLHNAGLLGELKPLSQYDLDNWQKVIQVNLTATFLLTRELLPLLRNSNDASIIFTSLQCWPQRTRTLGSVRSVEICDRRLYANPGR